MSVDRVVRIWRLVDLTPDLAAWSSRQSMNVDVGVTALHGRNDRGQVSPAAEVSWVRSRYRSLSQDAIYSAQVRRRREEKRRANGTIDAHGAAMDVCGEDIVDIGND